MLFLAIMTTSTPARECGTDSVRILGNDIDLGHWPLPVGTSNADHRYRCYQHDQVHHLSIYSEPYAA